MIVKKECMDCGKLPSVDEADTSCPLCNGTLVDLLDDQEPEGDD